EAIGPGRGPRQLIPGESRRMNLNDDVVYRCLRLGPLHQRHPGRSPSLVRPNDRLLDNPRSFFSLGEILERWESRAGAFLLRRFTGAGHGFKKGGMRRLAEPGNTTHELMAISGHRTLSEVQRYTEDATGSSSPLAGWRSVETRLRTPKWQTRSPEWQT